MRRIRICQLITELRPGGAERCVYELSRRLDRGRFDVQVAALRGGPVGDWLRAAGVAVTVLGVRGRWDVLKLATLTDLLRRGRIDIVHTHLFHADLAGRLAAIGANVPHLVHTVHVAEGRFRPWRFAFARLLAGRCDRVVAVSQAVRDDHARRCGLPAWRYAVIPNGIDASAYAADPRARRTLRSKWGIADAQVLLAFVGRLDRQKGIDILLSAMSHLGARGRPMSLVIAGDGPQRYIVENFIRYGEGGRHTRWLGFVGDVRGVLSAADVFVMPSRWEGLPLAAVEAMAANLPVIGADAPGLREVLDAGRAGLMIDDGDVVALAEAVERLSGDPALRARLAETGRRRAVQHYSIAANVAAHEALYEQVAAGPTSRWSLNA
jgi:glycosyltransferase involved in cell wall biosynthesis